MSVETQSGIIHVYSVFHYSMLIMLAGMGVALGALMVDQGAAPLPVAGIGVVVAVIGFVGGIVGTVVGEEKLKENGFWEQEQVSNE